MNTKLAANKQAEQSLDIQTIEVPADLRLAAVTSPGAIALCRLEGGGLMTEISEQLQQAAAASYNLTKKAEVTIKIKFVPGGARKMDIRASVSAKIPKEERGGTMLFVTPDGQLLAHDPDQQRMDLRVVKTHDVSARIIEVEDPSPLRKIDTAA
jgi:hypothetical protein